MQINIKIGKFIIGLALCVVSMVTLAKKPNILAIWGDDIGITNISAYSHGLVGYQTPNIDRLAKEGMMFTDYYAEQSCTAGRSTFILGQSVFRTGLSKVGLPGSKKGISEKDPTLAQMLQIEGYTTGQFGKNHLGDHDEMLPTNHGFEEFYGNLYHLNAEEEPEHRDYPSEKEFPGFKKRFGPRGVIHSFAIENSKQKIIDTGALTRKRMETIDDETSQAAIKFIKEAVKKDKPFFVWWNATRMHYKTHVKAELLGISGQNEYGDGMVEHDRHVGDLLDTLEELNIVDNTIVLYTTDNGPHKNTWPDAANSPFRSEKNTNWEGGWRVPAFIRWPNHIKAGSISNEIVSGLDWMPTFMAAANNTTIIEDLKKGYEGFKVHLDGYNLLPYLTGKEKKSRRKGLFYFSDDGELTALRSNDWKFIFAEQRVPGTFKVWFEPFVKLRIPLLFNLRRDPYEMANITSNTYYDWVSDHAFLYTPMQVMVGDFLKTFKEFPPRMKAASFTIDQILDSLQKQPKIK